MTAQQERYDEVLKLYLDSTWGSQEMLNLRQQCWELESRYPHAITSRYTWPGGSPAEDPDFVCVGKDIFAELSHDEE